MVVSLWLNSDCTMISRLLLGGLKVVSLWFHSGFEMVLQWLHGGFMVISLLYQPFQIL